MPAARKGDWQTFLRCRTHNFRKFISSAWHQQFANAGAIELRMDVIDPNLGFCEDAWRKREKRRGAYEFAPCQHAKV